MSNFIDFLSNLLNSFNMISEGLTQRKRALSKTKTYTNALPDPTAAIGLKKKKKLILKPRPQTPSSV